MATIRGDRLEKLMADRQISQSELARRVGLKQPSIGRLISGETRSSSVLIELARELSVSPAYLAGETDDPFRETAEVTLTSDEREWLDLFHRVQPKDRAAALHILRTLASRHHRPEPDEAAR